MPELEKVLLVSAVLLWGGVQYGLMFWALRDLMRRPRVRGDNKVVWCMLILTVPIVGALAYAAVAPLGPIARPRRLLIAPRRLATHDDHAA